MVHGSVFSICVAHSFVQAGRLPRCGLCGLWPVAVETLTPSLRANGPRPFPARAQTSFLQTLEVTKPIAMGSCLDYLAYPTSTDARAIASAQKGFSSVKNHWGTETLAARDKVSPVHTTSLA